MDIDECIGRLEGYGYTVNVSPWPGRLYMDGYGLRLGLSVTNKSVTEIDCYLLNGENAERLLGTTSIYPKYLSMTKCVDGIGMDGMFSVLSEPRKAAVRFAAMKLERELDVLEG